MATETTTDVESSGEPTQATASLRYGASIMALGYAGLGVVGLVNAVRILGGEGALESGVDIGSTTAELAAFNPALPTYIAHVRMASAGLFIGLGILGIAVTWYGVRRGERWAWAASVAALVVGTLISVPMHYSGAFHVDHARHLGPAYGALVVFVLGSILAFRGLGSETEP